MTESSTNVHWADNNEYDVAEDAAEVSSGWLWFLSVAAFVLIAITHVLSKQLETPPVLPTFPPPIVHIGATNDEQVWGWLIQHYAINCIALDGRARTITPNYENSMCQENFRKVIQKERDDVNHHGAQYNRR